MNCLTTSAICAAAQRSIKSFAIVTGALLFAALLTTRVVAHDFASGGSPNDSAMTDATDASGVRGRSGVEDTSIHPFRVRFSKSDIDDLRRRLRATRWPDAETVSDTSQGVQLATIQALVKYWGTQYDWHRVESNLNRLPQFTTTIDGVQIYFIHVRSGHPNALPIIITHGWPGSIIEQMNLIGPLTDPTAHGGRAEDAFDVVIPSLPGYGFSGKPTAAGWDPEHVARAWAELMRRLGYTRYVAQGGDIGAVVSSAMARQAPAGLLGIHINLPAAVPTDVAKVLAARGPAPAGLTENERAAFHALDRFYRIKSAYVAMMGTRSQTIGYPLTDSPAGLAAWMIDHDEFSYGEIAQAFNGHPVGDLTRDAILDNITLYWLTNSATSSARLYWENKGRSALVAAVQQTTEIRLPVAVSVFPNEIYAAPETWVRRAYPSLIYFHEADKGGHFAAWEQPELFAAELRAAFRPLR
jgi:pimeloyl-ACP methyl ester carboxylesterase